MFRILVAGEHPNIPLKFAHADFVIIIIHQRDGTADRVYIGFVSRKNRYSPRANVHLLHLKVHRIASVIVASTIGTSVRNNVFWIFVDGFKYECTRAPGANPNQSDALDKTRVFCTNWNFSMNVKILFRKSRFEASRSYDIIWKRRKFKRIIKKLRKDSRLLKWSR